MCQSSVLTRSADNIHTAHLAAMLDSGGSGLHYSDLLKTMYWWPSPDVYKRNGLMWWYNRILIQRKTRIPTCRFLLHTPLSQPAFGSAIGIRWIILPEAIHLLLLSVLSVLRVSVDAQKIMNPVILWQILFHPLQLFYNFVELDPLFGIRWPALGNQFPHTWRIGLDLHLRPKIFLCH